MSIPRYSCIASALTTSPPSASANSTPRSVLPVAVGPTTATGRTPGPRSSLTRPPVSCGTPAPGPPSEQQLRTLRHPHSLGLQRLAGHPHPVRRASNSSARSAILTRSPSSVLRDTRTRSAERATAPHAPPSSLTRPPASCGTPAPGPPSEQQLRTLRHPHSLGLQTATW